MSRQQLESIFIMPSAPIPTPRPAPRPKQRTPASARRPGKRARNYVQGLKNIHLQLPLKAKHFHPLRNTPTANQKSVQEPLRIIILSTKLKLLMKNYHSSNTLET